MRLWTQAVRQLVRSPGFVTVAALALALGIGSTVTIFSIVRAVFLRGLPYADADSLVQLTSSLPERQVTGAGFSYPRYQAVHERQTVFSAMSYAVFTAFTLTSGGGRSAQVPARAGSSRIWCLKVVSLIKMRPRPEALSSRLAEAQEFEICFQLVVGAERNLAGERREHTAVERQRDSDRSAPKYSIVAVTTVAVAFLVATAVAKIQADITHREIGGLHGEHMAVATDAAKRGRRRRAGRRSSARGGCRGGRAWRRHGQSDARPLLQAGHVAARGEAGPHRDYGRGNDEW